MSMVKKLSIIAAAGLLGLGAVGQANALCSVTGKVVQGYSNNGEAAYFYIAPLNNGFIAYNWYFYVPSTDPYNLQMLATANAGRHTVSITGDAASCPAAGAYRYGGTPSWLYVYPLN